MHRGLKYLSFLFLTAAFIAPVAISAGAAQEVIIRHDDGDHHDRYYDRNHRDYHQWNDREDHSYRLYLGQRHMEFHEFHDVSPRQQRSYWNWRHSHPDRDEDRRDHDDNRR